MGVVYWITGLSGAGKTTIAKALHAKMKKKWDNLVLLDGDELRVVFGSDIGYSLENRRISAMRNARLCKLLSDQGIHVICPTISMFSDVREWNRDNIDLYIEIYLKVPMDVLKKRDQKQLYSKAIKGEITDVIGVDLPFDEPNRADITIVNDGSLSVDEIVDVITQFDIVQKERGNRL